MPNADGSLTPEEQQEKVDAYINAKVQEGLKAAMAEQPVQQTRQPEPDEAARNRQELRKVLEPVFGDDIARAQLRGADAKDESRFYRKNPDATGMEEDIEDLFAKLADAGRPTQRQDIYDALRGKKMRENPDKWYEEETARRKAVAQRAEQASDFGSSGSSRGKELKATDLEGKTSDEIKEIMGAMTF